MGKSNQNWFRKKGILYWPISIAGWIIFIAVLIVLIVQFISIDRSSHSISDTLMNFVFNVLIIGIFYSLIAYFTSKKKPEDEKPN